MKSLPFKSCLFCNTKVEDLSHSAATIWRSCKCGQLKSKNVIYNNTAHIYYEYDTIIYNISFLTADGIIADFDIYNNINHSFVVRARLLSKDIEFKSIPEFDFSSIYSINEQIELLELLL